MIKRPVPHDSVSDALSLSLPIGSRSAGLEQLVEGLDLEAKAPAPRGRNHSINTKPNMGNLLVCCANLSFEFTILSVHIRISCTQEFAYRASAKLNNVRAIALSCYAELLVDKDVVSHVDSNRSPSRPARPHDRNLLRNSRIGSIRHIRHKEGRRALAASHHLDGALGHRGLIRANGLDLLYSRGCSRWRRAPLAGNQDDRLTYRLRARKASWQPCALRAPAHDLEVGTEHTSIRRPRGLQVHD